MSIEENPVKLSIKKLFWDRFQKDPLVIASPGRINLIGEHTDYNNGFVLPAAIDKYIFCAIQSNVNDQNCYIIAHDLNDSFLLNLKSIEQHSPGSWKNFICGIVHELLDRNHHIKGFDMILAGDIPNGSGMSSSAALANAIVYSLNTLFQLKLNKLEMTKISQSAEQRFAGVNCGIMDQFASMFGKQNSLMLLDCKTLEHQYVEGEFQENEIVLINSRIKHNLGESAYNARRAECEDGVILLHKKYKINSLSEIGEKEILESKSFLPEDIFKRCLYVVQENTRVWKCFDALKRSDFNEVGKLLFSSHTGLRDLYQVSCPELDYLVDKAKKSEYVLGSRMMGGGFGGCTINLIQKDKATDFFNSISHDYQNMFNKEPALYNVKIVDGISQMAS